MDRQCRRILRRCQERRKSGKVLLQLWTDSLKFNPEGTSMANLSAS